jgi:ABC-2 type transport system permease protein
MTSSTINGIAAKDWREFVRDRRLLLMAVMVGLIALAAVVTALAQVRAHEADRAATVARDRVTWESQGARNPHSVAHFATWALRPLTPMAVLDPGVTPYAGSAVWMEAHNRNPARARPVEDAASSFDLGQFSAAWVLQMLVPLLIFVIGAGVVARERDRGTLRLMLASGAAPTSIIPDKLSGLVRITALLVLPVLMAALAAALLAGPADPLRLLLWAASYALFFAIVAAIAVAVSALARSASQALLILIGLWLVAVMIVPRAGAGLAELAHPTPTADGFFAAMAADLKKQPDPFDGKDAEAFGQAMAKRYGVSRVEDLPVSLDGLRLEESERRGHVVFDRHYGALADLYAAQRHVLRFVGLLSPLLPLQNVSMALAGTDTAHQLAFQNAAEAHRRQMIHDLNMDMTLNGKGKDFDYQAGGDLWKRARDFAWVPPALGPALTPVMPDLLLLIGWAVAAFALLRLAAQRLVRGGV